MNSSEIMSVMQLLGWKDVSTKRQRKNGTQIFELPIKGGRGCTNIKVGSFKSGYVRRMNHCYTPYQLISVNHIPSILKVIKAVGKMVNIFKSGTVNIENILVKLAFQ